MSLFQEKLKNWNKEGLNYFRFLSRGGVLLEYGSFRIQYGASPETIKDTMPLDHKDCKIYASCFNAKPKDETPSYQL